MKINAKDELLYQLEYGFTIKCASLEYYNSKDVTSKKILLKLSYTQSEYEEFLEIMDFEYENDADYWIFSGEVFFEDGGHLTRQQGMEKEYWSHIPTLRIPTECYK